MITKEYKFYGWEKADVKDERGLTPRDYYDLLEKIWTVETCALRLRKDWNEGNKTLGQCSITAFLMQDIYGGKVYGIERSGGTFHCFNDVDGCVFDLTSEQFKGEKLDYTDCPEQFREVHFAKEEKKLRYELLKKRLKKKWRTDRNNGTVVFIQYTQNRAAGCLFSDCYKGRGILRSALGGRRIDASYPEENEMDGDRCPYLVCGCLRLWTDDT